MTTREHLCNTDAYPLQPEAATEHPVKGAASRTSRVVRGPRNKVLSASDRRAKIAGVLRTANIPDFLAAWCINGEYRGLSPTTIANRRMVIGKLFWFLDGKQHVPVCDTAQVQAWITYVRTVPERGRWGNADNNRPVRPHTVATYFGVARSFFNYCVKDDFIQVSPVGKLETPRVPTDQVRPFTREDVKNLLLAAKSKKNLTRLRDVAVIALLCETGMRVSELVGLRRDDIDLGQHQIRLLGKGNKERTVPVGLEAKTALMQLIIRERFGGADAIFLGAHGTSVGKPMTRSGVAHILRRLGKIAGITGARCSPHTCRHFAAVSYIENDADEFTVQTLLGHTTTRQTSRYVSLGRAALSAKVRKHSPLDGMKRREKAGR